MYAKKHQSMKCFVMVRMLYDALAVFKMCISGKVTHLRLNKPHGVQYGSHTWLVCTCIKNGVTQKWNFQLYISSSIENLKLILIPITGKLFVCLEKLGYVGVLFQL